MLKPECGLEAKNVLLGVEHVVIKPLAVEDQLQLIDCAEQVCVRKRYSRHAEQEAKELLRSTLGEIDKADIENCHTDVFRDEQPPALNTRKKHHGKNTEKRESEQNEAVGGLEAKVPNVEGLFCHTLFLSPRIEGKKAVSSCSK